MPHFSELTLEKARVTTWIDMVRHNIRALNHALTPRGAGASLPAVRRKIPRPELSCLN